ELQRDAEVGRIETGNASWTAGDEDFRAPPAGLVNERQPERGRGLVGRHAKGQRRGIRARGAAPGQPANAQRRKKTPHGAHLQPNRTLKQGRSGWCRKAFTPPAMARAIGMPSKNVDNFSEHDKGNSTLFL